MLFLLLPGHFFFLIENPNCINVHLNLISKPYEAHLTHEVFYTHFSLTT